jgi:hypothetical protein
MRENSKQLHFSGTSPYLMPAPNKSLEITGA